MAKLTFVLEDGQEVVVPLKEHITIGRDENNDIVVDDERISPHHAEIVQNADGSLQVFDLQSAAGTFVNGENQISCTLLHGDTIAFGPLVGTLDLEHPATESPFAEQAASPSPPPAVPEPPPAAEPPAPEPAPPSPPPAAAPPDNTHAEALAKLEAEKARLKIEVDAVEKELRDWQQRAEKERALHLARVESLRAEEEKLTPAQTAVKQAESAHHDWMEAVNALSSQHADKTAALERLNSQHYEKSTEVQRLTATAAETRQELTTLDAQKEEAATRLKQVRDECEQDEALLNSLRQQIIEHEKRIVEEEARHTTLNTASSALSAKQQRDEASIKDLEALLMTLEQSGAAAEGSLQRVQEDIATREKALATLSADLASCEKSLAIRSADLASCEKSLAIRSADLASCEKSLAICSADLASCEKSLAACSAELAAETKHLAESKTQRAEFERQRQGLAGMEQQMAEAGQRLVEARAQRAELEQQNQELAGTKQQLADARQRLAAVEQRYRDTQASGAQSGSQIAAPKRQAGPEKTSKAATTPDLEHNAQHAELTGQIEAARHELAELEAKLGPLRELQSSHGGEAPGTFPAPQVVHVETIRLTPIPIKSERTRGPGTKKAPPTSGTGKST